MQPKVSIVVPVFNGMPYLRTLAAAVAAQDYPNLEIIYSDGGSSDGSQDFLRSLTDPRVRIETCNLPGAAANWTHATTRATGEFIKLVCQDDLIYSTCISSQVTDLLGNPDAALACARRDIVDARGQIAFRNRGLTGIPEGMVTGRELMKACYLAGTNLIGEPLAVLFRREALLRAMPWSDDNPLMLDLTTYERVLETGSAVVRHASVGAFRVSEASWSTNLSAIQNEQTRAWQHSYAQSLPEGVSQGDKRKATRGRIKQVALRRMAYTALRARGRLTPKADAQDSA